MQRKYKEWKVSFDAEGEMQKEKPTKRGAVSITERTAEYNNSVVQYTKLYYELDASESDQDSRSDYEAMTKAELAAFAKEQSELFEGCGYENINTEMKKDEMISRLISSDDLKQTKFKDR